MRSINKVILIGNLTRDPEMRQTPNGQNVVTFGIATNREWITKDGRKQTSTEYHDLVAWAKLADICHKYLKKGKLVYVEGYLKTRSWDAPDGTKKFRTETVVQDMIMLDKRNGQDGDDEYYPEEETGYNNHESSNSNETSAPTETPAEKPEPVKEPEQKPEPQEPAPTNESPTPSSDAPKEEPKEEKKDGISQTIDIDSDLGL